MTPLPADFPASTAHPDLAALPTRVDRKTGAALVTHHFFPVTARGLEMWPVAWRMVNGKAICETPELFAVAQAKLDAAPPIRSVRRRMPASDRRIIPREAATDLHPAE